MSYDYKTMTDELFKITSDNTDISSFVIGKSVMEKDIHAASIGKGQKKFSW